MDKQKFLIQYLKFSGWLEIVIGIFFFFMDYIFHFLAVPNSIFFSTSAAVMLICMGFLLWYSAKDLERYTIIIITSCIFRYAMAAGPEILGIISIPLLAPIFIGGLTYDIFSATLTLVLLKQLGYLNRKK